MICGPPPNVDHVLVIRRGVKIKLNVDAVLPHQLRQDTQPHMKSVPMIETSLLHRNLPVSCDLIEAPQPDNAFDKPLQELPASQVRPQTKSHYRLLHFCLKIPATIGAHCSHVYLYLVNCVRPWTRILILCGPTRTLPWEDDYLLNVLMPGARSAVAGERRTRPVTSSHATTTSLE